MVHLQGKLDLGGGIKAGTVLVADKKRGRSKGSTDGGPPKTSSKKPARSAASNSEKTQEPSSSPTKKRDASDAGLHSDKSSVASATAGSLRAGCVGCECHKDGVGLRLYNGDMGYFNKAYLEKHEYAPKKCTDCGKIFVNKPETKCNLETEYSVKQGVYMCPKAALSHDPCMFAFCKPCRNAKFGGTPTKRRRTVKRFNDA